MSTFNDNLPYVRKQKGITQAELADKIGVNQSTISLWENGMDLTVENAIKVAEALDVPIPDFLGKDLRTSDSSFDELEVLFDKHKDILTQDDKDYIKFIIEKRKKEIDKELGDD